MYAPLAPIQAAHSPENIDVQAVLARIEALAVVLAAVGRLAGRVHGPPFDALSLRAELAAGLAGQSPQAIAVMTRNLDAIGLELQAGWLALERARAAARLNRAAAALLHQECSARYKAALGALDATLTR